MRRSWQFWSRAAVFLMLVIGIVIALECLRLFVFLSRLSPIAGWAFAAILVCLLFGFLFSRLFLRGARPKPSAELHTLTHREMRSACKRRAQWLRQLMRHPRLDDPERMMAAAKLKEIGGVLGAHPLNEDLRRLLRHLDEEVFAHLAGHLRRQALEPIHARYPSALLQALSGVLPECILPAAALSTIESASPIFEVYDVPAGWGIRLRLLRDAALALRDIGLERLPATLANRLALELPRHPMVVERTARGLFAVWMTEAAAYALTDRCAAFSDWRRADAAARLAVAQSEIAAFLSTLFEQTLRSQPGNLAALMSAAGSENEDLRDRLPRAVKSALSDIPNVLWPEKLPAPEPRPAPSAPPPPPEERVWVRRGRRHRHSSSRSLLSSLVSFSQRIRYGARARHLYKP